MLLITVIDEAYGLFWQTYLVLPALPWWLAYSWELCTCSPYGQLVIH